MRDWNKSSLDMHSEEWWIRALEGNLTTQEAQAWEEHRAICSQCRYEWEALISVDHMLRCAPPPPAISPDFTAATMLRLERRQQLQRLLNFLGGLILVTVVSLFVLNFFGTAYLRLDQVFDVLRAGRGILLEPLVKLLTGLLIAAQGILPIALGLAGALLLLMVPNGVMATAAVAWYSRQRRLM